jgi:hypothetical protein
MSSTTVEPLGIQSRFSKLAPCTPTMHLTCVVARHGIPHGTVSRPAWYPTRRHDRLFAQAVLRTLSPTASLSPRSFPRAPQPPVVLAKYSLPSSPAASQLAACGPLRCRGRTYVGKERDLVGKGSKGAVDCLELEAVFLRPESEIDRNCMAGRGRDGTGKEGTGRDGTGRGGDGRVLLGSYERRAAPSASW